MAIINHEKRELLIKIVYYGPPLSGKTTNLEQIHANLPQAAAKSTKTTLVTTSDRTLFFDFSPLEPIAIKGWKTKFALFTVPGQVTYNSTRQIVLRGVDGIVFVADSQFDKMEENIEAFRHLEENLESLNLHLADIPRVMQYNKRDIPNVAPVEYFEYVLNSRAAHVPSFPASARKGDGVRETLDRISGLVLQKFRDDDDSSSGSAPRPAPLNPFSPQTLSAHAEIPRKPEG